MEGFVVDNDDDDDDVDDDDVDGVVDVPADLEVAAGVAHALSSCCRTWSPGMRSSSGMSSSRSRSGHAALRALRADPRTNPDAGAVMLPP